MASRSLNWLITGCSSGFGLQFARLAQSKGHRVIATSRTPAKDQDLVDEIVRNGGQWLQLDLADASCGRVVDRLEAQGTAIDVLVNSAGAAVVGPVEHIGDDEMRRMMETNFLGPHRLVRAVLPHMRSRRSGTIINLSTGSGLGARDGLGGYGASKAALDNLTKVLASEVAEFNIRVLLVWLGAFNTPMRFATQHVEEALNKDYKGKMAERVMHSLGPDGTMVPKGDHEKAVRAIYDVALGEGEGEKLKSEPAMVLGEDCYKRAVEVRDGLSGVIEKFEDLAKNVNVD